MNELKWISYGILLESFTLRMFESNVKFFIILQAVQLARDYVFDFHLLPCMTHASFESSWSRNWSASSCHIPQILCGRRFCYIVFRIEKSIHVHIYNLYSLFSCTILNAPGGSTDRTKYPLHPGPCLHCLNDDTRDDDNDGFDGACFFQFPLDCVYVRSPNFYAAR